jgi:hypothetical protein
MAADVAAGVTCEPADVEHREVAAFVRGQRRGTTIDFHRTHDGAVVPRGHAPKAAQCSSGRCSA